MSEPPPATHAATAQIHVRLVSATGAPLSGEGFVVFKGPASAHPVVVPTKLPASAVAELPAGSQWTLIADFPGHFAAASILQVPRPRGKGASQLSEANSVKNDQGCTDLDLFAPSSRHRKAS